MSSITDLSTQNKYQRIEKVKPVRTQFDFFENKLIFINITIDSVNRILSQNLITGEIQSNHPFTVTVDNISRNSKSMKFDRHFSPVIIASADVDTTNTAKQNQLTMRRLRLKELDISYNARLKTHNELITREKQLSDTLNSLNSLISSLYARNKTEQELIKLRAQLRAATPPDRQPNLVLQEEIKILKTEIKQVKEHHLFSGYVSHPVIPAIYQIPVMSHLSQPSP